MAALLSILINKHGQMKGRSSSSHV